MSKGDEGIAVTVYRGLQVYFLYSYSLLLLITLMQLQAKILQRLSQEVRTIVLTGAN